MAWYRRRSADDTDGLMDLAAASRWRCPTGIKTEGLTKTPDARRRSRLVRGENWPCRWCITSTCPSQETDRLAGEKSIFNIPEKEHLEHSLKTGMREEHFQHSRGEHLQHFRGEHLQHFRGEHLQSSTFPKEWHEKIASLKILENRIFNIPEKSLLQHSREQHLQHSQKTGMREEHL